MLFQVTAQKVERTRGNYVDDPTIEIINTEQMEQFGDVLDLLSMKDEYEYYNNHVVEQEHLIFVIRVLPMG